MPRSIAELSKKSAKELRSEASQMMQKYPDLIFEKDGSQWTAGKVNQRGTKKELVEHLSKWEQEREKEIKEKEETKKPIEPTKNTQITIVTEDEKNDYSESELERLELAKKLYYSTFNDDGLTGIREYQLKLEKSKKYFLPEYATLVARARVMIESYANEKSPDGKAHPGTIQKIRVEVMKFLGELIDSEKDNFNQINDRTITDLFKDFDDDLRGAFKDIGAIKHQLNKEKNEKSEEDVRLINSFEFINWAVERVSNLPKSPAMWKEICIAVMLLTGRRQSEVMSSAIFTYVDESTVIFEGQLKRHTDELVEPEKIPVLAKSAKLIIDAIQWLEIHDKRTLPTERTSEAIQKAAKISHNRCSRYISESMLKLQKYCPILNDKEWIGDDNKNRFKGHLCRQIYAQICAELFKGNDSKKRAFISRILLENREAALNYDRDIEIKDINEISKLCGSFTK